MQTPQYLVRFFGNIDYAVQCLEEKKLTLPRANILNDPFDPPIYLLTDCPEEIGNLEESETYLRDKIYNPTFLACFSAVFPDSHPKNNLYMWGHYANGHRGIALEFDLKILDERLDNYSIKNETVKNKISQVKYGNFSVINKNDWAEFKRGNQQPFMKKFQDNLFRKTENWQHENEWRFMARDENTDLDIMKVSLGDNAVTKIYLGFLCKNENEKKIIRQAERHFPKAEIFKAQKLMGKLELDFVKISEQQ